MRTIRFTDDNKREEGARIIVTSGLVEYTPNKGVFRVPNYVLEILDRQGIPYEVLKTHQNSGGRAKSS
jgi:hypothetical protein